MNFLSKLNFLLRKPKIVIVTGDSRACVAEAIFQVLKQYFNVGKEVLIFQTDLTDSTDAKKFKFLVEKSKLPILVVSHIGDIPPDKNFFAEDREKTAEIQKIAKAMSVRGHLILNFDDEVVREIGGASNVKTLTFGFQEADFRASDIKHNGGINFKINYKGNIVPFWLENASQDKEIYYALAATAVATVFGLNLVEISQTLKNYH